MRESSNPNRKRLATLGAAVPVIILALIVLSLPLSIAQDLGLSDGETISWILALYGVSSILAIALAYHYQQPLLMTGNLFVIIFIGSLGGQLSYPELTGASLLAGLGVVGVGAFGLTSRLAKWIPAPVVLGLLVGAILPFLTDLFGALGRSPAIAGVTLLTFILWRAWFEESVPAILPALIAGLLVTAFTGQFNPLPDQLEFILPAITLPAFSLDSVLTAVPVMIVLITLQSNLPSLIYLKNEGYEVNMRQVGIFSGLATLIGSFLGPNGISLSLPATSLIGSDQAGKRSRRHLTVYIIASVALLIGLLSGLAAEIPAIFPRSLLVVLAGLAIFNIFVSSLKSIVKSPIIFGPMFALAVSLSDISLLGFGSFFWGLAFGTAISWLWEREELEELWVNNAGGADT